MKPSTGLQAPEPQQAAPAPEQALQEQAQQPTFRLVTRAVPATTPAVSVVLPTYNAGEYLLAAVRSVLDDGAADLELRVIDDGSTDGSVDALIAAVHDDRLIVVRQPNRGLSAALNRGIAEATGAYIARMDGDDLVVPGRFEAQRRYLDAHPAVVLVGGQVERMIDGVTQSTTRFPLRHADIVAGLLTGRHVLCHPSVMLRASALRGTGGYWRHGVSEDWDLFLRLSERGGLANLDQVVLRYRFHDSGINAGSMQQVRFNILLAVQNHRRRMRGGAELTPHQLERAIGLRGRLRLRSETRSLLLYRRAMLARADGRGLVAKAALLGAAVCWPRQALHRLAERR